MLDREQAAAVVAKANSELELIDVQLKLLKAETVTRLRDALQGYGDGVTAVQANATKAKPLPSVKDPAEVRLNKWW